MTNLTRETVLVVDDEEKIRKLVSMVLRQNGYKAVVAADGKEALEKAAGQPLDLIVLDYLLGEGKDGLQVLREIRQWSDVLIMFLSAKDADVDKIRALETGADDYLEKPFNVDELVARVKALLRRRPGAIGDVGVLEFADVQLDVDTQSVTKSGEPVALSNTEWRLIQQLAAHHDRVMTHEELLSAVWGPEYREDVQYLRVWMSRLRRKLENEPSEPRYLKTVAGIGYVLDLWGMLLGDAGAAARQALSPSAFEIAGAILVFLGMVLAGATLWGKWITGTAWYAVTNRRLLFLHGRTAASHWLGTYDFMTVQIDDHGDGTGDLLFRRTRAGYDRETGRTGTAVPDLFTELGQSIAGDADEQEVDVAFCGIRNAPAVRDLILRAYASVR